MIHEEAVLFIKSAINTKAIQYWTDLGCGSGTFTKALAALLPAGSHVTAVDRESQRFNLDNIDFVQADFERDDLGLSELDGILIANAIHYVADKVSLIQKMEQMFSEVPRFLIVEYNTSVPNRWVPFPITFDKLQLLFESLGYRKVIKLSERPSAYGSGNMYCALIEK